MTSLDPHPWAPPGYVSPLERVAGATVDEMVREYREGWIASVRYVLSTGHLEGKSDNFRRGCIDGAAALDAAVRAELDRHGVAATPSVPRPPPERADGAEMHDGPP